MAVATKRKVPSRTALRNQFVKAKTLWKVLQIALVDLRKAEKMKGVVIDMGRWHVPMQIPNKCYVCLAGSVIHCRLSSVPRINAYQTPSDYAELDECPRKLLALNCLRSGYIGQAMGEMDMEHKSVNDWEVPEYEDDRPGWWKAMKAMLKDLKAKNI